MTVTQTKSKTTEAVKTASTKTKWLKLTEHTPGSKKQLATTCFPHHNMAAK